MKLRPLGGFGLLLAAIIVLLAICAGEQEWFAQPRANVLEISFLDVGQGDAALITVPDGRHVLIDAGPRGSGVVEVLRRRGIDTLELVVASHNHADHIGGLVDVFHAVAVRNYMENGIPSPTAAYDELVSAIEQSDARVLEAAPRTLAMGEVRIHVLPMPSEPITQNERSIGLVFQLGDFLALFTGDAEEIALRHWVANAAMPRMSVVKVPHHGSRTGIVPELIQMTQPSVAVISVGAGNQFGHPSPLVVSMWTSVARYVLRTDREGTIMLTGAPDGSMRISTQRGRPPLRNAQVAGRPNE